VFFSVSEQIKTMIDFEESVLEIMLELNKSTQGHRLTWTDFA
jgi:hypothetical protein